MSDKKMRALDRVMRMFEEEDGKDLPVSDGITIMVSKAKPELEIEKVEGDDEDEDMEDELEDDDLGSLVKKYRKR